MEKEPKDRLIFVIGNPRSGTTMMARILGNHSSVHKFGELHFFESLWMHDCKLSISEASCLAARLLCIAYDGWPTQGDHRRFDKKARLIIQNINKDTFYPTEIYKTVLRYIAKENGKTIPCE